ncbi:thiamine-phosphate kinase [Vibrio sp.]|uniref:Thiamine-monophosphate kinase n=1 Tax=Vibrio viridaestus TaxID=2487322 RepID=A0A3N9U723_9VIBR|nr:thiamine-phosphate kinase [Vibrio viridaestus]MDC0609899.1 thiamine-phosphate kinase [Vibrio sp.]RQW63936.1 thiamine-phosphate kinase [Vibrio viridaestus]
MPGEFDIIKNYFSQKQTSRKDVHLDIGDDCAIVQAPDNARIAITTDTLVEGTHFLPGVNPAWVAYKALASNISDLAAMGATPAWCSLALTLPSIDENWIESFSSAFFRLADYYNIKLIGGDTTKGSLSITITIQGFVPKERAMLRSGANPGDWIYVTGELGDSQAGLDIILDPQLKQSPNADVLEERHYISTPRILAGQALVNVASSAIDISDGLISDLQHILKASEVGARLNLEKLPYTDELLEYLKNDREKAMQYALTSGEEYELCFTIPDYSRVALESAMAHTGTRYTCIGQIQAGNKLALYLNNNKIDWQLAGYDHFQRGK